MPDKTVKSVKVPEQKAEEWDEYVSKSPELDSMSHFIRLSVERQMNNGDERPQGRSDDKNAGTSGEVLTALRQIQTTLEDLDERISGLEELESAEAGYSLKKALWELLPSEPREVVDDEIPAPESPEDTDAVTPREVAQRLGGDVNDVEETLDELVETTGQVQRSDSNHDGNHYWKRDR